MRRFARIGSVALTTAALAAASAVTTPASAAGPLPTAMTLSATPSSTVVGSPVTLTARVTVLGTNGIVITPAGSVTFTARNSSGAAATLGAAQLTGCTPVTSCTAQLTTSTAPVGTVSVRADYPGDSLVGASSATAALSVGPNPSPGSSATVLCYSGQPCDTGTLTSTDNTTKLDVHADPSASNQAVSGELSGGTLHCIAGGKPDNDGDDDDGVFVGALATFSSTASDSTKTVTYTGTGLTGAIMKHQYGEHTAYAGCYGSPNPFKGYTHGVYGPAPFVAADGMYVAMLPNCANFGGQRPCMTNVAGYNYDSYVVKAPAGDPKIIG